MFISACASNTIKASLLFTMHTAYTSIYYKNKGAHIKKFIMV